MERDYKPGDEPVPRFVLRRKLGKGAFGEVWMAASRGGVNVALKIISLENKSGLKEFRAIRTVKNVHHPNLVPIIDIWLRDANGNVIDEGGEADSVVIRDKAAELIIAMGLGEKSLLDRLKECQKQERTGIPADELIHYMENAARAIDYLNFPQSDSERAPIQHCDIKPGNIMIVGGSAQVCDFGLARVLGTDVRATRSGDHMSVPYTSPELFWDASKPSQWSDQYSLAVTYIELRTGSLPFEHPTPAGMMFAHTQGKLDLSKLSPREQIIIRRATSVDAVKRFPTTMDMVQELRRANERTSRATSSAGPWAHDSLQKGTEIVPGYRLVRRIGQGGYGTVWEARAPGGRPVALKIICNLEAGTGRQEFKALELIKSLNHLHLLELHAYWLLDNDGNVIPDDVWNEVDAPNADTLVIATKLAQMNLQQRLHECQQDGAAGIPADELIGYMRQTALAIDYLNDPKHPQDDHMVSIQHRDIKPENILLVGGGTVQVGDFGLARVLEGTSSSVRRESRAFTPPYAAPELYTDKVTRWTDQYALALTYYKLRTGVLPFSENLGRTEIMMTHVEGKLDLSRLPETEKKVIARAVAMQSEQRFPNCLAMVDALDRALKADFPIGEAEPLLRPRAERQLHHTTPYNPDFESYAPPTMSVGTSATPLGRKEIEVYHTAPPDEGVSVTNTPLTQGNVTDKAPVAWPVVTPANPSAKTAWKPRVATVAKSRGSGMKYAMGAMLFLAVSAAGYFAFITLFPPNPKVVQNDTPPTTSAGRPETMSTQPTVGSTSKAPSREALVAEIDVNITRAESLLASDDVAGAGAAFAVAERLSREDTLHHKWNQIIFGKARCLGRQPDWVKFQSALGELVNPMDDAEILHRDFLVRLARIRGGSAQIPDENDLAILRRLDAADAGLDKWEEREHQSLREHVDEVFWKQIAAVFEKVPAEADRSALETAFDKANALAAVIKTRAPIAKQEQDKVIESLWTAARDARSRKDNPFEAYDGTQDAAKAKNWSETAEALSKKVDRPLVPKRSQELALALWCGTVDKEPIRERTAQLLASCELSDDLSCVPYQLAKAEAQPWKFEGWKTRFLLYDAIYTLLEKNKKGHAQDRYDLALRPALEHGKRAEASPDADAALKERLGRTFYAKAKFLDTYKGTVDGWMHERMKAAEQATQRWPDPDALIELCGWHRAWALEGGTKSAQQREYLEKAAEDAKKAAKGIEDDKKKSVAFHMAGCIHEELATIFGEKERYPAAIAELTDAIKLDAQNGTYLADRGRCWFNLSQADSAIDQADALENAKNDLQKALGTLSKNQQSEPWYWLAMAYRRQEKPDFRTAKDCLVSALENLDSKIVSQQKLCGDALTALLSVGDLLGGKCATWKNYEIESISDTESLAIAASCFHHFAVRLDSASISDYSLVKSEIYSELPPQRGKNDCLLYANKRIQQLAIGYWNDKTKQNFDKVLEIANLGIPKDLQKATYVNTYCLNRRNVLYAIQMDKLSPDNQRAIDQTLLEQAEVGVSIARKGFERRAFPVIFPATAHSAAAQLYRKKGDNEKAEKHLEQALDLPGLDEQTKNDLKKLKKPKPPAP